MAGVRGRENVLAAGDTDGGIWTSGQSQALDPRHPDLCRPREKYHGAGGGRTETDCCLTTNVARVLGFRRRRFVWLHTDVHPTSFGAFELKRPGLFDKIT